MTRLALAPPLRISGSFLRVAFILAALSLPLAAQTASSVATPAAPPRAAVPATPPNPASSAPNILDADKLLREGELGEAIGAYNKLIARNEEPALAYAGLARAYLKRHQVSDASASAQRALDQLPRILPFARPTRKSSFARASSPTLRKNSSPSFAPILLTRAPIWAWRASPKPRPTTSRPSA